MSGLLKKRSRTLALEMIEIQDASFGKRLEEQISSIKTKIDDKVYVTKADVVNAKEVKTLETIVMSRLGLKVNLITTSHIAAAIPLYMNKQHVFLNKYTRGNFSDKEQDKFIKDNQHKVGYVDTKNAKISGMFSEYNNKLYMNFLSLVKNYNMSPGGMTAIMLHELGHPFTAIEYSDRLESNNQILANVAKEVLVKDKETDLIFVYNELKKLDPELKKDTSDKIVTGNRTIAGVKLFKLMFSKISSQTPTGKYDDTSSEQMADNFATRFGYGRELITALDILHKTHYDASLFKSIRVMTTTLTTFLTVMRAVALISVIGTSLPLGIIMVSIFLLNLRADGDGHREMTYDDVKDRYKRIRNEAVNGLKNSNLAKDESKYLLDSIALTDDMIKSSVKYRTPIAKLSNVLFSSNRKAIKDIEEQQLLEDLAHNDLYTASAKLKQQA